MFSKQEAAQLRKEFWTVFGKYMLPVPSAEGEHINWINYKTGVKYIRFHMQTDEKKATVAIELDCKEEEDRASALHKFSLLEGELRDLPGIWKWEKSTERKVDVFITELTCIHLLRKTDWPKIISFFKTAMIALDVFWVNNKYIFQS